VVECGWKKCLISSLLNFGDFNQTVEHENAAEHIEPKRPLPPKKSHYFSLEINVEKAFTLPETNIAAENGWLEC